MLLLVVAVICCNGIGSACRGTVGGDVAIGDVAAVLRCVGTTGCELHCLNRQLWWLLRWSLRASLLVVQPLSVFQLHGLLPVGLQVEALLVVLFVLLLGLSKGMH
jgi:hypothetical protein